MRGNGSFKQPIGKNTPILAGFLHILEFSPPEGLSKFINGLNLKPSTGKG
jgi:hypothetical protein